MESKYGRRGTDKDLAEMSVYIKTILKDLSEIKPMISDMKETLIKHSTYWKLLSGIIVIIIIPIFILSFK